MREVRGRRHGAQHNLPQIACAASSLGALRATAAEGAKDEADPKEQGAHADGLQSVAVGLGIDAEHAADDGERAASAKRVLASHVVMKWNCTSAS